MRERLVAALVGTVLVVVTVMAVVRAYALAGVIEEQARATLDRSLTMATVAVAERLQAREPVTAPFLDALADDAVAITWTRPDGSAVAGGVRIGATDDEYAASRTLPRDRGTLTVVRPTADVARHISDALLEIVVLAIALLAAAAGAGWALARHLARPFQELADVARGLARGRTAVTVPHYAVAEAEAIGAALREQRVRLDGLLEREREFASSASHELRSPITALRLQVEGLESHPGLPPDARADVDDLRRGLGRLSAAVRDVLDGAGAGHGHSPGPATPVAAAPLVAEAVQRVTPRRARARVRIEVPDDAALRVPADPFVDVVVALVTNRLGSGGGGVAVTLADRGTHAELVVAEEGVRRGAAGVAPATTLPAELAPVAAAAERFGARLLLADPPTVGYRLVLPRAVGPGEAAEAAPGRRLS